MQVLIIGSGFGGMCAAIHLKRRGIEDFQILERRSFMGGTWMQNTYPGAAVDVQSPLYCYSFEPYDWTRLFAERDDLRRAAAEAAREASRAYGADRLIGDVASLYRDLLRQVHQGGVRS